jgi:hypothetical protein
MSRLSGGLFQQLFNATRISKILSHDSYETLTTEVAPKEFVLNKAFDFDHVLHF